MAEYREAFIGIDVAKVKNSLAIAEAGRDGEVRHYGDVDASLSLMRRTISKLAAKYDRLHFCYEAGPTGYGLHRLITNMGHRCDVIAPSLIPRKPGDRVKTNRRDAIVLARLLRAGELTDIWVPDEAHEAVRDLVRARELAVEDLRRKRQVISALMLRHGRSYPGKKTWGARHARWLQEQRFEHPAHQIVLQEAVEAMRLTIERRGRIESAIEEFVPTWSMAPLVDALQALRGVRLISAVTFVVEIGDLRRFESPRKLMAYIGLVPSENSTGDRVRKAGITKAGNARVRRTLVESAWTYRYAPKFGVAKSYELARMSPAVREIAWKAQSRLCARFRALAARGKKSTVAVVAVARELAGFMWAIAREVAPA